MVRVHAKAVVAVMADAQPVGNVAVSEVPRDPVSAHGFPVDGELAVSVACEESCGPFPARPEFRAHHLPGFVHFAPEPLFKAGGLPQGVAVSTVAGVVHGAPAHLECWFVAVRDGTLRHSREYIGSLGWTVSG